MSYNLLKTFYENATFVAIIKGYSEWRVTGFTICRQILDLSNNTSTQQDKMIRIATVFENDASYAQTPGSGMSHTTLLSY